MAVPDKPVTYRIYASRGNVLHAQRMRSKVGIPNGVFGQNVTAYCGVTIPEDDAMNVTLNDEAWQMLWNDMMPGSGTRPTLCHKCRKGLTQ